MIKYGSEKIFLRLFSDSDENEKEEIIKMRIYGLKERRKYAREEIKQFRKISKTCLNELKELRKLRKNNKKGE